MGEAKRRKEQGLPPKLQKKEKQTSKPNLLAKYPRLPLWVGIVFGAFLIWDLMKTYG